MVKPDNNQYLIPQIIGVALVALIISYPVTLMVKKANNPDAALTQERLQAFVNPELEVKDFSKKSISADIALGGGYAKQSEKYTNVGQAILTVNILNITRLTGDDFTKIGQTPWSLMNTVKGNLNTPQVFDIVFSNKNVVAAFANRETVYALSTDYNKAIKLVRDNDYVIERFVKNNVVESVLGNMQYLDIIINSKLVAALLKSPTGQYFIKNPAITSKMIKANISLKPLLENENLKKVLLNNPQTAAAAKIVFK